MEEQKSKSKSSLLTNIVNTKIIGTSNNKSPLSTITKISHIDTTQPNNNPNNNNYDDERLVTELNESNESNLKTKITKYNSVGNQEMETKTGNSIFTKINNTDLKRKSYNKPRTEKFDDNINLTIKYKQNIKNTNNVFEKIKQERKKEIKKSSPESILTNYFNKNQKNDKKQHVKLINTKQNPIFTKLNNEVETQIRKKDYEFINKLLNLKKKIVIPKRNFFDTSMNYQPSGKKMTSRSFDTKEKQHTTKHTILNMSLPTDVIIEDKKILTSIFTNANETKKHATQITQGTQITKFNNETQPTKRLDHSLLSNEIKKLNTSQTNEITKKKSYEMSLISNETKKKNDLVNIIIPHKKPVNDLYKNNLFVLKSKFGKKKINSTIGSVNTSVNTQKSHSIDSYDINNLTNDKNLTKKTDSLPLSQPFQSKKQVQSTFNFNSYFKKKNLGNKPHNIQININKSG